MVVGTLASGSLRLAGWMLLAAAFGALTIVFEFLTGGLPLGAAAVLGLGWFFLAPPDRSIRAVLLGLTAFAVGAATVAGVKLVLVGWVFGMDAVLAVVSSGGDRMQGPLPSHFAGRDALEQVILNLGVLTAGLPLLGTGLLALALGLGLLAALRHCDPPVLLLGSSLVPIIGWFLLFQQHTAIHAWFMTRILVWPRVGGFALFGWSLVREVGEEAAGRGGHARER